MAQERVLGYNEDGEEKWHEGSHLPQGWYRQDPTAKKAEPVETVEEVLDPPPEPKTKPVAESDMQPKLIPDPPAPKPKKEPVKLDEDGDEPLPPPVEKPGEKEKRKPGRSKRGD